MRKAYLAVLSLFGLAGSTVPAQAQVLKGSKEPETTKNSTIKSSKAAQEGAAGKDAATHKGHKAGVAADASSKDAAKMTKATAEKTAIGGQAAHKKGKAAAGSVKTDALTVKQKGKAEANATKTDSEIKLTKGASADVVNEKRGKSAAEKNAAQADQIRKAEKTTGQTPK